PTGHRDRRRVGGGRRRRDLDRGVRAERHRRCSVGEVGMHRGPVRAVCPGRALDALDTLDALSAGVALRALGSSIAGVALRTLCARRAGSARSARRPLWALRSRCTCRSGISGVALDALRPGWTLRPVRACGTGVALRPYRAGGPLRPGWAGRRTTGRTDDRCRYFAVGAANVGVADELDQRSGGVGGSVCAGTSALHAHEMQVVGLASNGRVATRLNDLVIKAEQVAGLRVGIAGQTED